ncbi:ATP-binding protein [Deefgea salmonis]|uniref:histidine kinase n=1 Tax=Deefgea salmonis TaxID=2875502 RepID=A0ABS8BJZ2_9NEIS|nr:ATP-binding protein [Deefgea salmonis]MCB5196039.1 HAMP domain-containing protein [Deefgea salmonis]
MFKGQWQWLRELARRARLMSMPRWLEHILPSRLLPRLLWVMAVGVLASQLIGNAIWANYLQNKSEQEVSAAADHIARGAVSAVHFFQSLPPNYRPLVIQQLREMGGTRFFVTVNDSPIPLHSIAVQPLSNQVLQVIHRIFEQKLPQLTDLRLAFAWPNQLAVSSDGMTVSQLPDHWIKNTLLMEPRPAPVLVIQTEIEPGHWLYLATLMPDPYFLDNSDPMPPERWLLQLITLITVLLLTWVVVRWITRPLAALSEAAEAFGKGESPPLPAEGSEEFIRTAHAFGAMRERIQRYLEDREKLFAAISHDLRTPITRLKLRTEMLDDEAIRLEFHEDLDELDMMVKGALQSVKDSDIHENRTRIRLDALLGRMVRDSRMAGHEIAYSRCGLWVMVKPLALKRALSNLIDNALFYAERVEISVLEGVGKVVIVVRDHGPGVPDEALATLFDPYVRLEHGRQHNHQGHGLGLGIARNIIQAHGGVLELSNHSQGGLQAMIILPKD